jgi:hypothetical protein
MPVRRGKRPVNTEAVAAAGTAAGEIPVPYLAGYLGQIDAALRSVRSEETKLDACRDAGEDGEIGTGAVIGRAERVRKTRPDGRH